MKAWFKKWSANRRAITVVYVIGIAYECYVAVSARSAWLRAFGLFVALLLTYAQVLNTILWREADRYKAMAEHFKKVEEFFKWLQEHAEPVKDDDADAGARPHIH